MLKTFEQYLRRKSVIKEKYIPYYLKWISDGYRFFELSASQALDNDQREQFLKHLSKSHEDWQVNQADYALRLYGYFLSLAQKKSLKDTSDATEEWRLLEAKTRDALRLRHRSYRTEKTYLSWLRRFMVFVHGKILLNWVGESFKII